MRVGTRAHRSSPIPIVRWWELDDTTEIGRAFASAFEHAAEHETIKNCAC